MGTGGTRTLSDQRQRQRDREGSQRAFFLNRRGWATMTSALEKTAKKIKTFEVRTGETLGFSAVGTHFTRGSVTYSAFLLGNILEKPIFKLLVHVTDFTSLTRTTAFLALTLSITVWFSLFLEHNFTCSCCTFLRLSTKSNR